jgi:O-methyltransferase
MSPRQSLVEIRHLLGEVRRSRCPDESVRLNARFWLLDRFRRCVFPEYRLTDHSKRWFIDDEFFRAYNKFLPDEPQTAERKFFLRELVRLVSQLDGDTAEAGVYTGASSWFICAERTARRSTHWGFDSFDGLSTPNTLDGKYWYRGDLAIGPDAARDALRYFDARVLQGWIPDVFQRAAIDRLVFAHIDVDLYEPTLASMEYFYPLLIPGGIIVCDDYGFSTCPGAKRAIDEYMSTRPEPVLHCPTGQGIIVKE